MDQEQLLQTIEQAAQSGATSLHLSDNGLTKLPQVRWVWGGGSSKEMPSTKESPKVPASKPKDGASTSFRFGVRRS